MNNKLCFKASFRIKKLILMVIQDAADNQLKNLEKNSEVEKKKNSEVIIRVSYNNFYLPVLQRWLQSFLNYINKLLEQQNIFAFSSKKP